MCGCLSHAPYWGTWPETQACALAGNRTGDPLVCRPALNPLSYTNQGHLLIFREKGRKRERGIETPMCGCLSCTPTWDPDPQLRHVP